ncbi:MAG: serine/threonine-protein kinase [Kofleriaceae bacterium]
MSDLSGSVLDDRYQVLEPIAEGAMGAVYRGERLKLGRAVAIKIMHDALPDELASRQRFEREAKLMARLEHPHCVSVIDFGLHDGRPYLVMELVRGTSLLEELARVKRIEPGRAAEITRQVLSGLAHAHELGIVHRDIKPANVMLTERTGLGEQVRILDFGLARPATDSTKLTTGIVVGTPNYMAPEQIKGGAIDARTDLYAVGVMLFELLTGSKPFIAEDPLAVVRKHLHAVPPTLAEIGKQDYGELEAIVATALAKSPQHRFQTAAEFAAVLEPLTAKEMSRAVPHRMGTMPSGQTSGKVATESGWQVPASDESLAPTSIALGTVSADGSPVTAPGIASGPVVVGSGPVIATSGPVSADGPTAPGVPGGPSVIVESGPAPQGEMNVPPTRRRTVPPTRINNDVPATRMLPIPGIALTKTHLWIGGGVLAIVMISIIAAKCGGGSKEKVVLPVGDGSSMVISIDAGDPVAPALSRASDLYANGDLEPALDVVIKARRAHPESAQLAYLAGKIYFAKLWWTDGVKAFRDAIRLDPGYRADPELPKIVLRGFITTPDVDSRIEDFVRELGEPMRAGLEETAKSHPSPQIRSRASNELKKLK